MLGASPMRAPLRDRKFADSSLEEAGFEPSVPRDNTWVSRGAHSPLLDSLATQNSTQMQTGATTTAERLLRYRMLSRCNGAARSAACPRLISRVHVDRSGSFDTSISQYTVTLP